MKKAIKKTQDFKVKLDHRTTVTVRTKEALRYWVTECPNAKVLS